jgi:hypothetical protein
MSADNYIYIDRKTFKVYECVASCVSDKYKNEKDLVKKQCTLYGQGKNLEEAVDIAEKCADEYGTIEYGVSFIPWCG